MTTVMLYSAVHVQPGCFLKTFAIAELFGREENNPSFVVGTVCINRFRRALYKTFTDILHVYKAEMELQT